MRTIVLLLCLFLSSPLLAKDVYKWTNEEGVVIYSDTYRHGAERIRVSGDQSSPHSETDANGQDGAGGGGYSDFEIVKPENDATVRSDNGTVAVGLALSPALAEGHAIKIVVDGNELEGDMRGTQFSLNNLSLGTHNLVTRIVDAEGNPLTSSNSVNFHLRKAAISSP